MATETAKHTPGPWKTSTTHGHFEPKRILITTAQGYTLADCGYLSHPQVPIDARLIASAPELLKACRQVAQLLNVRANDFPKHLKLLNAAITKANQCATGKGT